MDSGPGCRKLAYDAVAAGMLHGSADFGELRDKLAGRAGRERGHGIAGKGDEAQLARVRAGDREAYRYFVEKYQERGFAIAYSMVRDAHDAEDIVQESFVKAYLSLTDFRSDSSFYTWFYRIVYNMAVDFKRKAVRRETLSRSETAFKQEAAAPGAAAVYVAGPHDMAMRREQAEAIQRVLGRLSDEHRAVMVLREIDGLSYDEIARVTGVSKGTVMSRLFYARRKMQEALVEFAPSGWKGGNGSSETASRNVQNDVKTASEQ